MNKKISITKQINKNDCGICVIHALIQHFHGKEIPFTELASNAQYSEDGMSIYDLENLGAKYGVNLESYNLTFQELMRLNEKKFVVLILNQDGCLHYVIARNNRQKKNYTIYCSVKGEYQLTYHELNEVWCNIAIGCHKGILNYTEPYQQTDFFKINWKWFFIMNAVNILLVGISIFCGTLLQNVMNALNLDIAFAGVFSIIITYLLAFLSQYLLNWIITAVSKKYCYQYYQLVHSEVLKKLANKYNSFFQKVDYKYLLDCDELIFFLANFYIVELNQFISNAFLTLGILIIICTINIYVCLIALACILIIVGTDYVRYKFQHENWNPSQTEINSYKHNFIKFIAFIKNNNYIRHQTTLYNSVIESQQKIKYRYFKNDNFNNFTSFIDSIIHTILSLALIMLLYTLVRNQTIDIGQLILCTSLIAMLISATRSLCQIPSSLVQVAHAKEIIKNILEIDNAFATENIKDIEMIDTIQYDKYQIRNDTIVCGKSGIGKTYLMKQIANMITDNKKDIQFNEIRKEQISTTWFKNSCIYLNQEPCLHENVMQELFMLRKKELVIHVINKLGITTDKLDHLSTGQKQVLSFLQLLECQNKIILLDEALSNVDNESKNLLLTVVKPEILKSNFLVYVDHNLDCCHMFKNEVSLHE